MTPEQEIEKLRKENHELKADKVRLLLIINELTAVGSNEWHTVQLTKESLEKQVQEIMERS